ncbi:hypothetical protein SAMN02910358_00522 [Lachnospiraceae bacterium XBB1006]|nr:hypothetical protein SAMN02910358_00522 [Lachnospiraceae bacterium XBB1006]
MEAGIERIVEQSLLYDFYGELLTEHQRQVYEACVFDDYSLSEVAKEEGISRQGVHDLLKRCNKTLEDYEEKLHLVEKFKKVKKQAEEILELTNTGCADAEMIKAIRAHSERIIEEL